MIMLESELSNSEFVIIAVFSIQPADQPLVEREASLGSIR
jgi:hypothetical protein